MGWIFLGHAFAQFPCIIPQEQSYMQVSVISIGKTAYLLKPHMFLLDPAVILKDFPLTAN